MKAEQFFNTYLFQQLCRKYPLQNILYSPINTALHSHFNQHFTTKTKIEGIEFYGRQQLKIAEALQAARPAYFSIQKERDLPFKINFPWGNTFLGERYDIFYPYHETPQIQRFVVSESDHINKHLLHFQTDKFYALRIKSRGDILVDFYVPNTVADYQIFYKNITLNNLKKWDTKFTNVDYFNIKIPAFDIDFKIDLDDDFELKNSRPISANLSAWKERVGHYERPIEIGRFGGGILDYGKLKIIDVDRPFYLVIHSREPDCILQIAAIAQPFSEKRRTTELANLYASHNLEQQGIELSVNGQLAVQYWCLQQLIDYFKVADADIDRYLKTVKDYLSSSESIQTKVKLIQNIIESLEYDKHLPHDITEQLKLLIRFGPHHSFEEYFDPELTNYLGALATKEELFNSLGTGYYFDALAKSELRLPKLDNFNAFSSSSQPFLGGSVSDFDFSAIQPVAIDVPNTFLQQQINYSQNYTTFRLLKAAWWDYDINEKLSKVLACMDIVVEQQKIVEKEWEKMRQLIVKTMQVENVIEQKKLLAHLRDYTKVGTKDLTGWQPEFEYLSLEIEQDLFALRSRQPFLYEQMTLIGYNPQLIGEYDMQWGYTLAYRFFENHLDAGYNFPFEITTEKVVPDFTP